MTHKLDAKKALEFMLAGNAIFTVRSQKTQIRYTYKVTQAEDRQGNKQQRWFVSLLSGPENTSNYTYLGMIDQNGFRLTKASQYKVDSVPVIAFTWVYANVKNSKDPVNTEIWHEGRCGRCGRVLTVPESIESGFGPECVLKVMGAAA